MANGDSGGSSSTLIFAFIVGFLGLSTIFITAGIMWPRFRVMLAERFGLFPIEDDGSAAVSRSPRPQLWEVCVRGQGRGRVVSECAWEHLRASVSSSPDPRRRGKITYDLDAFACCICLAARTSCRHGPRFRWKVDLREDGEEPESEEVRSRPRFRCDFSLTRSGPCCPMNVRRGTYYVQTSVPDCEKGRP